MYRQKLNPRFRSLGLLFFFTTAFYVVNAQTPMEVPFEQTTSIDSLKILSWNIYMLPISALRPKNFRMRSRAIGEVLQNSDYDILVFQEAFRNRARTIIKEKLTESYPYQYGPGNEKGSWFKSNSGVWVLSKIPLKVLNEIKFDRCRRADCFARKGAMLLQGNYKGQEFQLVATHCQNQPFDVCASQYEMIHEKLLSKYEDDNIPQIICGDFNCKADITDQYNEMIAILDAEDPRLFGKRRKSNRAGTRLDYIFMRKHRRKVKFKRQRIVCIGPDLGPGKKDKKGRIGISDHYGVEMKLLFHTENTAAAPKTLEGIDK